MAGAFLLQATPVQTDARLAGGRSPAAEAAVPRADFGAAEPDPQARHLADWVARVNDHQGQAFFLIDKQHATLYAFDAQARLQASTSVLLGAARGDDSVPGIGMRPIELIRPSERTTPAGRFVAEAGRNASGEDVVWVDHDAAVSMHRVRTTHHQERRAERLATATVDDNRISYGCINVPVAFYERHVRTVFAASRTTIVYVLPETRSLEDQFGLRPWGARADGGVGGHAP